MVASFYSIGVVSMCIGRIVSIVSICVISFIIGVLVMVVIIVGSG